MPTRRTCIGRDLVLIQGGRAQLTAALQAKYRGDLIRLARHLLAGGHPSRWRPDVEEILTELVDLSTHDLESVVLETLEQRRREVERLMRPGEDRIPSRRPRRTGPIPAAYEDERKPKGTA